MGRAGADQNLGGVTGLLWWVGEMWYGFFQTSVEPGISRESCWNFVRLKVYGPKLFILNFITMN